MAARSAAGSIEREMSSERGIFVGWVMARHESIED
jgi:hypothetical protein